MFVYKRKVQYHETDKMNITHHANYIKWMEEARVAFLESIGLPFQSVEERGIVSPVAGLSIDYRKPSTFGDEINIEVTVTKYAGAKLEFSYTMRKADSKTDEVIVTAASKHGFLKDGRLTSVEKAAPDMHDKLVKFISAGNEQDVNTFNGIMD